MGGVEHLQKPERNVERDRVAFMEAIKSTVIREIETGFDERAVHALAVQLETTKLFLLGETHGVKENPDIIYTLFRKFGFKNLALEWSGTLEATAERFLEAGDLNFDAVKDSPDGRITAGHFALLKKLKEEGLLESLICFDGNTPSGWDDRDRGMADVIAANLSKDAMLVVAGSLHAGTVPVTFLEAEGDTEREHHPLGEILKDRLRGFPSGRIEYLSGQFHNYGIRDITPRQGYAGFSGSRFYLSPDGMYRFELPEAHAAVVPDPSETLA